MQTNLIRPGSPDSLGATWDGQGTNFALYSESATGVELCLFDSQDRETRVPVTHRTELVWHVYVQGIEPGQRYGYRVSGPWEPKRGLRFNPANVLLDPYARALSGVEDWGRGAFSYDMSHADKDLVPVKGDQRGAPLAIVVDGAFDWGSDELPRTPLRRSVIQEAHVRGLTQTHPDLAPELRGTYLGVASQAIIAHLLDLGVTALELLPVHGFVDDKSLLDRGLRNYWGYNSIAFFAPDVRYRSGAVVGAEVAQFKQMVKALHAAGIEVILDVVYNHTAEGNHLGPTFSFRGIDNPTYYRLVENDPRFYFDFTGTGNTFNTRHPQALRLVMDSLRYWASEMHVDGFRFDLASSLARAKDEVDQLSSFFTVIRQDPVISRRKLIAEPWDVGEGGYQVGRFPLPWAEWNGKYRDNVRAFWKGDGGRVADLGHRLTGSSDLYQAGGRSPSSSVNFITCHDGFTLRDLVSYNEKHNDANGEGNHDGNSENHSWNCGSEGETTDANILALRRRQIRNLLSTLFLSQGTPMLCAGDELGRTQGGNNNAYCLDSPVTWHDWSFLKGSNDDERKLLLEFTRNLVRLRREHPLIQQANFFNGREIRGVGVRDVVWFRHDGELMTDEDWSNPTTSSLGVFIAGSGLAPMDEQGRAQSDDDLLLILNASSSDLDFVLPAFAKRSAIAWNVLLDTGPDPVPRVRGVADAEEQVEPGRVTHLGNRSLKLFSRKAVGPGGVLAAYGTPVSTYRLQLGSGVGFKRAQELAAYFDELGVGGVYTSPILRAEAGSPHGYDVVDHASLNPELGSLDDYRAFADELTKRSLRNLIDYVPNHVGIGTGENPWWNDVLESGPSSLYADFFDIEWSPPSATLQERVLLPVLGQQFGAEVDQAKLHVHRRGGALLVQYYEHLFPAAPRSYLVPLERARDGLVLPVNDRGLQELESILSSLRHLPPASTPTWRARSERALEKEIIKRRLAKLCEESAPIAAAIDAELAAISGSPDRLEKFLEAQHYRLSYWRVATEEINYRRFFDVNGLAAIRMEDPAVFAAAHQLVLDLISEGRVTGLRLDHTDGLYDPEAYFNALQASAREALRRGGRESDKPIYAVAEKICAEGEGLPRAWSIFGTTGYDFLAKANGLWVDRAGETAFTQLYAELAGASLNYADLVYQSKRDVMDGSFSSEIHVLGHLLKKLADASRWARDFTLPSLIRALKEVMAALPIYRTYVKPDGSRQKTDESRIHDAIALAELQNPMVEGSVFEFLEKVLLLQQGGPEGVHFAMRFQQLSGPIMAKGTEDTAFYRYNRLVGLNEVGTDPSVFGTDVDTFHAHNVEILGRWPLSMTTTTTHDTKRSEDARARLAVLSEIPEEWGKAARELDRLARGQASQAPAATAISKVDSYLFLQSVVGAFPLTGLSDAAAVDSLSARMVEFMGKAIREAKVRTSWTTPNAAYEQAVERYVRAALSSAAFRETLSRLVDQIAPAGAANSLAQLALRLASPGISDIYQGCESWTFTLVDPDNRRPVDFDRLGRELAGLRARGPASPELARELVAKYQDGRIKMHVTATGLRLRREMPGLFLEGHYQAIDTGTPHLVAFERKLDHDRLICVVPRLSYRRAGAGNRWALGAVWGDESLLLPSGGEFRNVMTGEQCEGDKLPLAKLFETFPVAWLLQCG